RVQVEIIAGWSLDSSYAACDEPEASSSGTSNTFPAGTVTTSWPAGLNGPSGPRIRIVTIASVSPGAKTCSVRSPLAGIPGTTTSVDGGEEAGMYDRRWGSTP